MSRVLVLQIRNHGRQRECGSDTDSIHWSFHLWSLIWRGNTFTSECWGWWEVKQGNNIFVLDCHSTVQPSGQIVKSDRARRFCHITVNPHWNPLPELPWVMMTLWRSYDDLILVTKLEMYYDCCSNHIASMRNLSKWPIIMSHWLHCDTSDSFPKTMFHIFRYIISEEVEVILVVFLRM